MSAIKCGVLTGTGAVVQDLEMYSTVHTSLGIYGHFVHIAKLQTTRRDKNADSVSINSFLHKVDG